jgi:leucyl-tRNA synthetase
MGYDAFGLPAENHAIKTGQHPRDSTNAAIAAFQQQFREWGISVDWSREFGTHEPRYYRWTQWIFLQLFKHGLAYRKEAAVNWCPNDATVLANEQVIDGRCERCGFEVEVRQLEQWFFRITDYADRLLADLDTIEWPEHVKTMQRNWIGRSEGAEVVFRCEELGIDYPVFTTRPDTLFGATFFVVAPEHPDIERLAAARARRMRPRLRQPCAFRGRRGPRRRGQAKTGVFLGRHVVNPVNGEALPMYVADYVLREYGTGAIMAVPRHDERDFAFARPSSCPCGASWRARASPAIPGRCRTPATAAGQLHPDFDGLHNREALQRIVDWLTRRARARSVNYRCATGSCPASATGAARSPSCTASAAGSSPCPRTSSVVLPDVEDYAPKGRSPLAAAEDWVATTCPDCGGPAGARRTRWTPSSTPRGTSCATATRSTTRRPGIPRRCGMDAVDQYIGGVEHAILTCSTARFFVKALPISATSTCRSRSRSSSPRG